MPRRITVLLPLKQQEKRASPQKEEAPTTLRHVSRTLWRLVRTRRQQLLPLALAIMVNKNPDEHRKRDCHNLK